MQRDHADVLARLHELRHADRAAGYRRAALILIGRCGHGRSVGPGPCVLCFPGEYVTLATRTRA